MHLILNVANLKRPSCLLFVCFQTHANEMIGARTRVAEDNFAALLTNFAVFLMLSLQDAPQC